MWREVNYITHALSHLDLNGGHIYMFLLHHRILYLVRIACGKKPGANILVLIIIIVHEIAKGLNMWAFTGSHCARNALEMFEFGQLVALGFL